MPYTDSFNRADDNDLGSSWRTATAQLQIISNECRGDAEAGDYDFSWWQGVLQNEFFANDQYSEGVLAGAATGTAWWLTVRADNILTNFVAYGMLIYEPTAQVIVYRIDPGPSPSQLAVLENSTVIADGDVYRLSVEGTTLRAYRNSVELGSGATDSGLASGAAGIGALDLNEGWASWQGGDLVEPRFLLVAN